MSRRYVALCGLLSWAIACDAKRDYDSEQSAAVDTAVPPPADTLVGTAPGGVEIWFTLSRESVAADGTHCIDRTIEIRRGGSRVQVPLLYTGAVPELVNDSTIRARLSNRCAPGDAYLVDLRSGRPVRER